MTQEQSSSPASLCPLCSTSAIDETSPMVNKSRVCQACFQQLQSELDAQELTPATLPLAIVGATTGALLGAAAWAAIVEIANVEVGYIALLIGFLSAKGSMLAAGKARGKALQIISASAAALGLLAAKYIIFDIEICRAYSAQQHAQLSYFSPVVFSSFIANLSEIISPYDFLWLFISLSMAYRLPKRIYLTNEHTR